MAVKGAYRRNPSDEVEAFAVATVADWVGDRGAVAHTGKGHAHGPDFRIDYTDERVGRGEVSWHADPAIEEMWANTFLRDRHQVIELDDGPGQWGLRLRAGANIGQLYKELPALIDSLAAARIRHLEVYDSWPRGEVADRARALGIDYISHASDDEPARAVFFMPSQPGVAIPSDPDVIVDWVEEVLAAPEFADVSAKLLALLADERQRVHHERKPHRRRCRLETARPG